MTTTTTTTPSTRSDDAHNISEGDALFNKVAKLQKLTSDGENWLKTALDPFPDETRVVPGFPDMISSKSIRYPVKIETIISDGGLGAAWDVMIASQGFYARTELRTTTQAGNTYQSTGQGATVFDIGGFQIRRALAGTQLDMSKNIPGLLPPIPANPFRVVSYGMEVENVTEPLYRAGSCVSFRMPSVPMESNTSNVSTLTTTAGTAVSSLQVRELPVTAAEALNLPDSVSDTAEAGTYMVAVMDGPTNSVNQIVSSLSNGYAPSLSSAGVTYFPQITGAALPFGTANLSNTKIPYNAFGAYFTGLSSQTKLKVTMHAFIEEFPPPSSTLLASLATPSATYDPQALVLYSRAVRHLPVAVPVKDNFIGSFFLEAAKSIASWAAPKLLKGWDKTDEEKELKSIKDELKLIKEMRVLEQQERMRVPNRAIVVSPGNAPRIVTNNSNGMPPSQRNPRRPPPLPPRDYLVVTNPQKPKTKKENKNINKVENRL